MRGATVVEMLVAAFVGLLVLSALTGGLAAGGRALARIGARAEASDTAQLAAEAFLFDVRRAGYDETAAGIAPLVEAHADLLVLEADLDGDGVVDPNSTEHLTWYCNPGPRRLSRIVGVQSMPLADRVVQCAFGYLDAAANVLTPPAAGLDAAQRAAVASVVLDLALEPRGGGLPVERSLTVALRSSP